jgi:hypothetical protein
MKKHNKIISFIRALRNSFHEATIVYTHGACYEFYNIMKNLYPEAEAYMTEDAQHVVVKIGGRFYDITGWYVNSRGKVIEGFTKLTEAQHENWEACISGQLMYKILKKAK